MNTTAFEPDFGNPQSLASRMKHFHEQFETHVASDASVLHRNSVRNQRTLESYPSDMPEPVENNLPEPDVPVVPILPENLREHSKIYQGSYFSIFTILLCGSPVTKP